MKREFAVRSCQTTDITARFVYRDRQLFAAQHNSLPFQTMAELSQRSRIRTAGHAPSCGNIADVSEDFHIEDRVRGYIVAAGHLDANGRVIWEETEASVQDELSELAEQIEQHHAAGFSGGQLRPPLEWFIPFTNKK